MKQELTDLEEGLKEVRIIRQKINNAFGENAYTPLQLQQCLIDAGIGTASEEELQRTAIAWNLAQNAKEHNIPETLGSVYIKESDIPLLFGYLHILATVEDVKSHDFWEDKV